MPVMSALERNVLLYLKAAVDRNLLDGVNSREVADNIDSPIREVNDACEKLDQINMAHIIKRHMEKGAVKSIEVEITSQGLDFIMKEMAAPM